jgi:hypothetical protein
MIIQRRNTVRFNPNLYDNGKVCLSLLGTWNGERGETWIPHQSTMLQVLISIQSLILVAEPFFNEPGYEKSIGTPQGIDSSRNYNETVRLNTMRLAILNMIVTPTPFFETAIKRHFQCKKDTIIECCRKWTDASSPNNKAKFVELTTNIENALIALG